MSVFGASPEYSLVPPLDLADAIVGPDYNLVLPLDLTVDVTAPDYTLIAPYGEIRLKLHYKMAVWHIANEDYVRWEVEDVPDVNGDQYPGPGTLGVDTTSPAWVSRIRYD